MATPLLLTNQYMSNIKSTRQEISDEIYAWDTEHKEGFTSDELNEVLDHYTKEYPGFNTAKWDDAMMCLTRIMKNNEAVFYHTDVVTGILCGIENRNLTPNEFD